MTSGKSGTSAGIGTGQHTRMLTAMFDSREDAEEAIEELIKIGIPRNNCRLVEGETTTSRSSSTTKAGSTYDQGGRISDPYQAKGFWDSLADLFMPDEDRYTYAEGLSRGGYLLSVNVPDAQYEKALDILDNEGTINIDERAEAWRNEGWSWDKSAAQGTRTTPSVGSTASAQTSGTAKGEEAIPIVEEQLRVGKRDISGGRVRVRSYVVEQPVSEQVTLRDEKVSVERRPVDRAVHSTEDAFQERTIEANERREEAVIDKQARVKEEVVVRKDAQQRTETVSDTVRQTKVEVDDQTRSKTGSRKGEREAG
jgi:uncharacterized protein (TIGR02271 family)